MGRFRAFRLGKRVVADFSEKNVSFMAAGIAYNALVSLAPLLILLLLIVSVVGGDLEGRLIDAADGGLPGPIADVVTGIFSADSSATGASLVGLVVLLWGTLKIFRGLDTAFSAIYETDGENSLPNQVVDGAVVLGSLVVSVLATVAVSVGVERAADRFPLLSALSPVVLLAGLILAFFPMYYRFPDTDLGWRDVLPGTVFAAVGWGVLQGLFRVYLAFGGSGVGNFFGGVLVVVSWLYFSGLVLLVGAVLNAVIGGHASDAPDRARGGLGSRPGPDSRESLDRDELAGYLTDLREQLTGRYEGMVSRAERVEASHSHGAAEDGDPGGGPRYSEGVAYPNDGVEVVEQSSGDGDDRVRSVTLRWRTPGADPDE